MTEPTVNKEVDNPAAPGLPVSAAESKRPPLVLTAGEDIRGYIGRKLSAAGMFTVAAFSVLAVALIFIFIARESIPFLRTHSLWSMLTTTTWTPEGADPTYGVLAMIYGTLVVTVGAMLIATPLGLLGAVFMSDIAPFAVREIIKPVIELLAAIPSVAYGFYAVLVLGPWMQTTFGMPSGANALNASIMLAIMATPTIASVAEDALTAAGSEIRAGAYALGATRAEVLLKAVFPAAAGGLGAGLILGMMRAIGETMVVWMAAGNAVQIPTPWWDLTASIRTMTATVASDMPETVQGSNHYYSLWVVALMLLVFTFALNLAREFLQSRAARRSGGGA